MKTYLPNGIQKRIVERFMSEEELEDFAQEYQNAKLVLSSHFQPTEKDWKLYKNEQMTIEDYQKHWKIKKKPNTLYRLGLMTLMEKSKKKQA